jgi:hypothetical protein
MFPNGKHYIGLTTTSLEQRTKEHKNSAKNGTTCCVYNAIRKYEMVDKLELVEIDTADTIEELREKEIKYIIEYNSYYINENGYNMTCGGEGANGYVYTEEDNKKNSDAQKKRYEKPEAREQISEGLKKYYEKPEARQKCSEAKKKYYEKPDAKRKLSDAMKKRYEKPDTRRKLSRQQQHNPFDVFKKDGTFIKTFTYQFEAKEYLQTEYKIACSSSNICAVLAGRQQSSAGFVFKYK